MNLWLKRAIGAAGIAVGFLLLQGSPAGASELTQIHWPPRPSTGMQSGSPRSATTAGRITSGNLGEVEASPASKPRPAVRATPGARAEPSRPELPASRSGVPRFASPMRRAGSAEVQQRAGGGARRRRVAEAPELAAELEAEVQQPRCQPSHGWRSSMPRCQPRLSAEGRRDAPKATRQPSWPWQLDARSGRRLEGSTPRRTPAGSTPSSHARGRSSPSWQRS